MNIACVSVLLNGLADANKRLLNCMGYQTGPMVIAVIVAIFHIGSCYIIVYKVGLGIYGPALTTVLSNLLMLVLMTAYSIRITDEKFKKAWIRPSKDSFNLRGLHEFMKIGGPSTIMTCIEWWSFELMTVVASFISIEAVATQITVINNSHVFFMPHFGLQISACILVGEEIGAQRISRAKKYHKVLEMVALFWSNVQAVFIFFARYHIAEFYTNIPELSDSIAHVLTIYAFYHTLDGNKSVSCGVMRGLAKQSPASIISIISYYIVSLPFQYLFAFSMGLEVFGLWAGQMCAAAFHMVCLLYLIYFKYDWNLIGREAYERVQREKQAELELEAKNNFS